MLLHLKRNTPKDETKTLEEVIVDLQQQIDDKDKQIANLESENLSTISTLLDLDLRMMDLEMQIGV